MTAIRNLPDDRIFEVREATAGDVIRVKWTDAAGVPLTLPQLTAVTVTYYDGERPDDVTAGIVNGRNVQAIITAGAIVNPALGFDYLTDPEDGKPTLFWTLALLDTPVKHAELDSELHGLLFRVTHTGGGPFSDIYGLRILNDRWVP